MLPTKSDVIQWSSFDGTLIEGILLYPLDYKEGQRYPLIVVVHDGPYEAWKKEFIGKFSIRFPFSPAIYTSKGYAVLLPNIRGSSNYGISFANLNYKDLGGGDFKDLLAGVDFLIQEGIADSERLAIWGWGYGGYLTAWATTQTNRFKAAIVGAGMTDLISFAGATRGFDFLEPYMGGSFWQNKDCWRSRSPMMHVERIETPLLLHYGVLDEIFPFTQAREMKYVLKKRDIPFKMLLFFLEDHPFNKFPPSRRILNESALDWLEKHLSKLN